MNIKQISCAITLSLAAALPMSAMAHTAPAQKNLFDDHFDEVLYPKAKKNKNLDAGEYDFLGLHSKQGSTFVDEWKFTLADESDIVLSIDDYEASLGNLWSHSGKKSQKNSAKFLLDNKLLTFSLFDSHDNLLGSAGEGSALSLLGLAAGEWYTITISAKVNGLFGSAYHGTLAITPTEVPLGSALPFFASAVLATTIGARRRKTLDR